jgi:phosphocarrier protein HPr
MMGKMTWVMSRQVVVVNELGLHARSAAGIAKLAENAGKGVWIAKQEEIADAKSILDIISLVCPKGTSITIGIDDTADEEILNGIVSLIEGGFGE